MTFLASLATSVSIQTRKQCRPSRIRFLTKRDGQRENTSITTHCAGANAYLQTVEVRLTEKLSDCKGSKSMEYAPIGAVVRRIIRFETKSRLVIKPSLV